MNSDTEQIGDLVIESRRAIEDIETIKRAREKGYHYWLTTRNTTGFPECITLSNNEMDMILDYKKLMLKQIESQIDKLVKRQK